MEKNQSQSYLYQKRVSVKQKLRPLKLEKYQKAYIKKFLSKNGKLVKLALLFLILTVLIEVSVPIMIDIYIKKYSFLLEINKLMVSILLLLVVLGVYLVLAFLSIKYEKTIIVHFLNKLRRSWFERYLRKKFFALKGEDKGRIMTKISYHFSLLQMGVTNSIFSAFNLLLLIVGLVTASFFIDSFLLFVVLIMIPVNLFIMFLGYIVSKYYVSRDQTLYSKILMYISRSLEEFFVNKQQKRERSLLKEFDRLVDVDTYFRIRRELWLKYGNKIIFVFVSFVFAGLYLLEIYYPFVEIEHSAQYVVYGIFLGLLVKQLYLSLRVGLFSFPAKLGAVICVPDRPFELKSQRMVIDGFSSISFKSNKIKYEFETGERILFAGGGSSVQKALSNVFAGEVSRLKSKSWIVKVDGKRLYYKDWQKKVVGLLSISSDFYSELPIIDYLVGKDAKAVSREEIEKVYQKLSKIEQLEFLFEEGKVLSRKINLTDLSFVEKGLLQLANALIAKPRIVVIEHVWLDIENKRINEMIDILNQKLDNTVIICFSNKSNTIIEYDKVHKL